MNKRAAPVLELLNSDGIKLGLPIDHIGDSSFQATKAAMIFNHTFWTTAQAVAFIFATYLISIGQKSASINSFAYSHFGALATVASFGQLIFGTFKAHPTNGKWIVLNFCVVIFFQYDSC